MQDFLSIFTSSGSGGACTGDVVETSNSTTPPATQPCMSERNGARRPDRPTTLTRPVQLPTCCNFRRQPWTTYVHGEFSYTAAPRCYSGVDEELGAAADNDAVVKIIESLQITDKHPCSSNGCHGDDVNNPGDGNLNREERILNDNSVDSCSESKANNGQKDSKDPTAQNARKCSPEVVAVQIPAVPFFSGEKDTRCSNGLSDDSGSCIDNDSQQNGKVLTTRSERCPTRQMRQDINQNLRPIDGAKHSAAVVQKTKNQCETGTGKTRQRPESPPTGIQQKSKSRRSRNRSLVSRDEQLTNGGAERHQKQHGGRKSTRSRTLSPALTERFDYHVSRPVQTDPYRPEVARRDVTVIGCESSAVCFRPSVHRKSRGVAASTVAPEHDVNGVVRSSPTQSRRSVHCHFDHSLYD